MKLRSVHELKNIRDKRILVRVDFDVGVKNGRVPKEELKRIEAAAPTIKWLQKRGAQVIILTHLGRPDGKYVPALRTKPLVNALRAVLGNNEFIMLENVRFDPREEKNDPAFARELAALGDIFVNDAFGVSHRVHASVVGITQYLPSYAGFSLEEELKNFSRALMAPRRSLVLVMGGIKIETKLPVIKKLLPKVDRILVGGALAAHIKKPHPKILLPVDYRNGGLDIGPRTEKLFIAALRGARTIVWNGPLGKCEDPKNRRGTFAIARAIARETRRGAFSVVGGGDTIPCLYGARVHKSISFISTGGGAMLEYLAGARLPGLVPLYEKGKERKGGEKG